MEPISIAAATVAVIKYVLPAIKEFGEQILEKSTDAASDTAVGFGRRLLHTLLGRRAHADQPALEAAVERRVIAVANDPAPSKASIQLEGAIEDLLTADPDLLASIVDLLDRAPVQVTRQGDRTSFVGRDNHGPIINGDGNIVTGR